MEKFLDYARNDVGIVISTKRSAWRDPSTGALGMTEGCSRGQRGLME